MGIKIEFGGRSVALSAEDWLEFYTHYRDSLQISCWGRSELIAYCPFCGSTASPPLTINLADGSWHCRNCGRIGGPLELLSQALFIGKEAAFQRVVRDLAQNPVEKFLLLHFQEDMDFFIPCQEVYASYRRWALESGYQPEDMRQFGRELRRVFSGVERRRGSSKGPSGKRKWLYRGIRPSSGPTKEWTGRASPR